MKRVHGLRWEAKKGTILGKKLKRSFEELERGKRGYAASTSRR